VGAARSFPFVEREMMIKSKETNANTMSRAERLADANRHPDIIVLLAALRLLCWRVGTKTKALLDLARKCHFDLGKAGSWDRMAPASRTSG
jgi:hypothetical protein